jgi:CHAT domain-containing protein/tetratricopeptide (TPR) repeat protein
MNILRKASFAVEMAMAITLLTGGCPGQDLQPGLVVEKVNAGSAAEKTGIREADILLHWSMGAARGDVEPLYGLEILQREQSTMGPVTLTGLRAGQSVEWKLGDTAPSWGIQTRPDMPEDLLALHRTARQLAGANKPTEAVEHWQEAAVKAEKLQSGHGWLSSWFLVQAGNALADSKKGPEAEALYQEVIQKQVPDSLAMARVLFIRGDAVQDPSKMADYLGRASAIFEKLAPESPDYACSLTILGVNAFIKQGDMDRAMAYLKRALATGDRLWPESSYVAANLNALGFFSGISGDLANAEDYHQRSLAISEKLTPGGLPVAYSLNNLGLIASARGDLAQTEDYFRRALAIKEKLLPGSGSVANTLNNLGMLAIERGDYTRAESYHMRALDMREKIAPGGNDVAVSWINLGQVELDQGNLDKAEEYFNRALTVFEKIGPHGSHIAADYNNLGEIEYRRSNLDKAEEYLRRSLAIWEKLTPGGLLVATNLSNLGLVAYDRGNLSEAEDYQRRALAIQEKLAPGNVGHAETLARLASIERRKGNESQAAKLYGQAVYAMENQTAHLGGSEDVRSAFRAKHLSLYGEYAELLLKDGQIDLAYQVVERSRARGLLEILSAAHVDIRQGVDAELLAREKLLQSEIAAKSGRRAELLSDADTAKATKQLANVDKEIAELTLQYGDVEGQIRSTSPVYAALSQPQPISAKEVEEKLLDPETVLLEYLLGDERSYVFAVTQKSVVAHELPRRSEIEGSVRHVYQLLTERNNRPSGETLERRQKRVAQADADFGKAAAMLSDMLLGPIAEELSKSHGTADRKRGGRGKRLIIVGEGALLYLPFAALPMPHHPLVPLIAEHEIINLPSASSLALLRQQHVGRQSAARAVAVIADPVFSSQDIRISGRSMADRAQLQRADSRAMQQSELGSEDSLSSDQLTRSAADVALARLPRLLRTREEARSILAAFPEGQGMMALDFKASRATATAPDLARYRIVHFATHGILNSRRPELSGLVLSLVNQDGSPQNGFLGLQDIYNLNLPADLVVLSACQTALGPNIRGEGMMGLTRGFMYAGATRVVASLWEISDQATAQFMAIFYQSMEQRKMRPAAALQAAQLEMSRQKRWNSPFYWAAFQIQGEWR